MSSKLSVIIPCKNERENIVACVASAQQIADEVLVADSGSTDGTLELARALGCRIIERDYGTSGDFKNWAIPQAAHDWVFILDADERIAAELAAEIKKELTQPRHDGYWVYRLNHFMGHPIRHGAWRNDRCLRLFRRDLGRYVGPNDHAEVELCSGTVGCLRERLTHFTCTSYSQYLPKVSRYAEVQSRIWQEQGRKASWFHLMLRFPLRFVQGYVLRLGFLDGLAGLQVCALVAYLSWLKQAYLWQLQASRNVPELASQHTVRKNTPVGVARPESSKGVIATQQNTTLFAEPQGVPPKFPDRVEQLGEAGGRWETRRKLSFREFRRRLTPRWLQTNVRRRWRNILYRHLGIQRCYTPPIVTRDPSLTVRSCLPFVVAHELLANPRTTFLQIGAFDGVGDDDLHALIVAHKLRGVLVEPQPIAFARLQQTYRHQPNVALVQAAIAEQEGPREFYVTRRKASMAASFDRRHLLKHGIPDREIVSQQVHCLTVESALRAAGLQQVDLIQIDAEGYDWPIIRSIDFSRLRPRIVRFEYRHMAAKDADACLSLLAKHGYRFIVEARDVIAIHGATSAKAPAQSKRRSA